MFLQIRTLTVAVQVHKHATLDSNKNYKMTQKINIFFNELKNVSAALLWKAARGAYRLRLPNAGRLKPASLHSLYHCAY